MRHAYLILCHTDSYVLNTLVRMLDVKHNDIYVLPDKKSPEALTKNLKTEYADLKVIPKNKRIDARWGDETQIEAELTGFEQVINGGEYDYIHLLSGQDLPIKSQDKITEFFSKFPKGTNFIGLAHGEFNKSDLRNKTEYRHYFLKYFRHKSRIITIFSKIARRSLLEFQKILKHKRKWQLPLYKGSNWVSITPECAKYLIDRNEEILKIFKGVPCADEIYKQSIIMNSPLKNTLSSTDMDFAGNTRKIDWERGKPYTWHKEDLGELLDSDALFARKFNSSVDKEIIDKIESMISR